MNAIQWVLTRTYTFIALALGAVAIYIIGYDTSKLMTYFLLPFYLVCLLMQFALPKIKAPLEKGELTTDLISNTVTITTVNALQNMVLGIMFAWGSSSLLIHFNIIDESFGLANLPIWAQALCAFLIADFFFYVTHRMAHEVPFFWKFHSIHHSAHRVTFMNAYRVHPVDAMFRRYVPLFFVTLSGVSIEALSLVIVFSTILATVTHMNVDLRHGWFNYIIATNELHRWHHSKKYSEAKNFALFTLWDHLFGTYYWPRDRDIPEETGLGDETNYPLHNYWQLLLIPFRWNKLDAKDTTKKTQQDTGRISTNEEPNQSSQIT
ncbi:MAG: fatty acid hydroxylase family protein [Oceanobacter sp.]|jgi:sterol desaturase/sphingolipid hydroxylase (fatty acid hydroxylase superfamily)|nr:MAG: fatty acid hydroxylase family protein [Oceanobacter sp.]